MMLASLGDLAVLTRLPVSNPRVELALRRASSRFEGDIGYSLRRVVDDVVLIDGQGTRVLQLPALPVVGSPSIQINNEADPVDPLDYDLNPHTGQVVLYADLWPVGAANITATYTHGFETQEDVPGDVQDAVLEHAVTLCLTYAHIQQESAGSTQESHIQAALVGVTGKWADTVARYRIGGHN